MTRYSLSFRAGVCAAGIVLAGVALVAAWQTMAVGADMVDEAYQIVNGLHDWRLQPLAPLTALVTAWLGQISPSMLFFRIVAFSLTAAAVVVTAFVAAWRTPWRGPLLAGCCLMLAAFIGRFSWFWGWDPLTYFVLTLTLLALLAYLRRGSWAWFAMLAVLCSLAPLLRAPNVVAVAMCVVAICWFKPQNGGGGTIISWHFAMRDSGCGRCGGFVGDVRLTGCIRGGSAKFEH